MRALPTCFSIPGLQVKGLGTVTNFCRPQLSSQVFRCAAHFTEVRVLQRVELALQGPGCASCVGHKFLSGFLIWKGKQASYRFLLQMPRTVTSGVLPAFPLQSSPVPNLPDGQDSSLVSYSVGFWPNLSGNRQSQVSSQAWLLILSFLSGPPFSVVVDKWHQRSTNLSNDLVVKL